MDSYRWYLEGRRKEERKNRTGGEKRGGKESRGANMYWAQIC